MSRYCRKPTSFEQLWPRTRKQLFGKKSNLVFELRSRWPNLAGRVAEYTQPEKLWNKKLFVAVRGQEFLERCQLLSLPMLDKLREDYPRVLVTEVIWRARPQLFAAEVTPLFTDANEDPSQILSEEELDEIAATMRHADDEIAIQIRRLMAWQRIAERQANNE